MAKSSINAWVIILGVWLLVVEKIDAGPGLLSTTEQDAIRQLQLLGPS